MNNSKSNSCYFFGKKCQNVKNFTRQNFGLSFVFLERGVTTINWIVSHQSQKNSNHVPMCLCALLTIRVRQTIFQKSNFIFIFFDFGLVRHWTQPSCLCDCAQTNVWSWPVYFYIEIEFDRDLFFQFRFFFIFFKKLIPNKDQKKKVAFFEKANPLWKSERSEEKKRQNKRWICVEWKWNENDFSKCKHCSKIQQKIKQNARLTKKVAFTIRERDFFSNSNTRNVTEIFFQKNYGHKETWCAKQKKETMIIGRFFEKSLQFI